MHRPIWGVKSTSPSTINRITTSYQEAISADPLAYNFYEFNVQFARYHAIVALPGECGQQMDDLNYNSLRIVVLNLRRMEVEDCLT